MKIKKCFFKKCTKNIKIGKKYCDTHELHLKNIPLFLTVNKFSWNLFLKYSMAFKKITIFKKSPKVYLQFFKTGYRFIYYWPHKVWLVIEIELNKDYLIMWDVDKKYVNKCHFLIEIPWYCIRTLDYIHCKKKIEKLQKLILGDISKDKRFIDIEIFDTNHKKIQSFNLNYNIYSFRYHDLIYMTSLKEKEPDEIELYPYPLKKSISNFESIDKIFDTCYNFEQESIIISQFHSQGLPPVWKFDCMLKNHSIIGMVSCSLIHKKFRKMEKTNNILIILFLLLIANLLGVEYHYFQT